MRSVTGNSMFSGIVEAQSQILSVQNLDHALQIKIQRPEFFDDIKIGDSVAVNGACLTIESFTQADMSFTLAAETLKILNWTSAPWTDRLVNLERSLRFGDRIHGHLVSGHVDELATVVKSEKLGESWLLDIKINSTNKNHIWKKGSVTIHGTSLTVNDVMNSVVSVCLIPETIKRTNLASLKNNDLVNIEFDWMAKALIQSFGQQIQEMRSR